MASENLFIMHDVKQALVSVQELESECPDFTKSVEVFAILNRDGKTDWYVSLATSGLSAGQVSAGVSLLSSRGRRSEQSHETLFASGTVLFRSTGGIDQILHDLEALGESQRDFRANIQLN